MNVTLNKSHTHVGIDHTAGVMSPSETTPRGDNDTTPGAHDHAES